MDSDHPRVMVGGLPTCSISRSDLAHLMVEECLTARSEPARLPSLVFSSNGQGVSLAAKDPRFRNAMLQASIIHGDGFSTVLASRLTKAPLPERVATTDFFHDAARLASSAGLSFYIFGGSEQQNSQAVAAIQRLYPDLVIAGRRHGYFGPEDNESICANIRASGADVLWVGLGKPLQEFWSVENRERLRGIGWLKTCGGLYAFLSGESKRAPEWMQISGLEWLYRTMQNPRRLAWRYLTTNPHSLYQLVKATKRDVLGVSSGLQTRRFVQPTAGKSSERLPR